MPQPKDIITKEESPNADYYLENGKVVFTSYFLSKRGYCCESGCRHCPYNRTVIKLTKNNILQNLDMNTEMF
ncbi:MAG: DUF5522 domain-containing protein [Saprospiraceae bacterium]